MFGAHVLFEQFLGFPTLDECEVGVGDGTEVVADVAFVLAACGHERFDGLEEFFDVLGLDGYSGVNTNHGALLIGWCGGCRVVYDSFTVHLSPRLGEVCAGVSRAVFSRCVLCCAGVREELRVIHSLTVKKVFYICVPLSFRPIKE